MRDPMWERSDHAMSRDGSRVPIPWQGDRPPYGFTEGQTSWLPMPEDWASLTVEAQLEDPGSMLSLYRAALELRRTNPAFRGDTIEWYGAPDGCLAFRRKEGGLVCALNTRGSAVPLPPGQLLLASHPLDGGNLPTDAAAWLTPS
jgi:alpha-glucosidase